MDKKWLKELKNCTKCDLHKSRSQVVIGEGSPESKIWLIGINPGEMEDKQGLPFVGASGNILRKAIRESELQNDVYITNVCRCHSPSNREPTEKEATICMNHLSDQIIEYNPIVIVAVGAYSYRSITGEQIKITKDRGSAIYGRLLHEFDENNEPTQQTIYHVLPILHPSYILRRGSSPELINTLVDDLEFAKELRDEALEKINNDLKQIQEKND